MRAKKWEASRPVWIRHPQHSPTRWWKSNEMRVGDILSAHHACLTFTPVKDLLCFSRWWRKTSGSAMKTVCAMVTNTTPSCCGSWWDTWGTDGPKGWAFKHCDKRWAHLLLYILQRGVEIQLVLLRELHQTSDWRLVIFKFDLDHYILFWFVVRFSLLWKYDTKLQWRP